MEFIEFAYYAVNTVLWFALLALNIPNMRAEMQCKMYEQSIVLTVLCVLIGSASAWYASEVVVEFLKRII